MRVLMMCAALALVAGCTSKRDVLAKPPIYDQVISGDYAAAAACVHNGIQTADYTISPQVSFIPGPNYAEVQTTASGMTGTIYGQVTRFDKIDAESYRVVVRAVYRGDGEIAVAAVKSCVGA